MDVATIDEKHRLHALWLRDKFSGERADFSGENLRNSDFSFRSWSYANFAGAYLDHCDLSYTNLSNANLSGSSLFRANLSHANLFCADLSKANLRGALLSHASLGCSILTGADLSRVEFFNCTLMFASLAGATINWRSHPLIAAILWQAAGDNRDRRLLATHVAMSLDKCWAQFLAMDLPERDWAIGVLSKFVKENQSIPEAFEQAIRELKTSSQTEG